MVECKNCKEGMKKIGCFIKDVEHDNNHDRYIEKQYCALFQCDRCKNILLLDGIY